jgi:hypothetical protein
MDIISRKRKAEDDLATLEESSKAEKEESCRYVHHSPPALSDRLTLHLLP